MPRWRRAHGSSCHGAHGAAAHRGGEGQRRRLSARCRHRRRHHARPRPRARPVQVLPGRGGGRDQGAQGTVGGVRPRAVLPDRWDHRGDRAGLARPPSVLCVGGCWVVKPGTPGTVRPSKPPRGRLQACEVKAGGDEPPHPLLRRHRRDVAGHEALALLLQHHLPVVQDSSVGDGRWRRWSSPADAAGASGRSRPPTARPSEAVDSSRTAMPAWRGAPGRWRGAAARRRRGGAPTRRPHRACPPVGQLRVGESLSDLGIGEGAGVVRVDHRRAPASQGGCRAAGGAAGPIDRPAHRGDRGRRARSRDRPERVDLPEPDGPVTRVAAPSAG